MINQAISTTKWSGNSSNSRPLAHISRRPMRAAPTWIHASGRERAIEEISASVRSKTLKRQKRREIFNVNEEEGGKDPTLSYSVMQSYPNQHNTNDKSNRNHLANERCMMFLDLRFHKRIQSAVNIGHSCFLPATRIAQGAWGVLLFPANRP
jgi:hypothetical protein